MDFYDGTLTAPVTLQEVAEPGQMREFPAGTAVTVAMFDDKPDRCHLNAQADGGQWDTYAGWAPADAVQVGQVTGRCN